MSSGLDSQFFDSYVPIYDVAPQTWDEGRAFLVEQLKAISNAVNAREIGFYLDQELLAGKQFIPGSESANDAGESNNFRTILRKVIVFPGLTAGVNTQPHGLQVDANFTLFQMWGSATKATAPYKGEPIPNGADTISYDATNIIINVAAPYTRAIAVIEYMQEL